MPIFYFLMDRYFLGNGQCLSICPFDGTHIVKASCLSLNDNLPNRYTRYTQFIFSSSSSSSNSYDKMFIILGPTVYIYIYIYICSRRDLFLVVVVVAGDVIFRSILRSFTMYVRSLYWGAAQPLPFARSHKIRDIRDTACLSLLTLELYYVRSIKR